MLVRTNPSPHDRHHAVRFFTCSADSRRLMEDRGSFSPGRPRSGTRPVGRSSSWWQCAPPGPPSQHISLGEVYELVCPELELRVSAGHRDAPPAAAGEALPFACVSTTFSSKTVPSRRPLRRCSTCCATTASPSSNSLRRSRRPRAARSPFPPPPPPPPSRVPALRCALDCTHNKLHKRQVHFQSPDRKWTFLSIIFSRSRRTCQRSLSPPLLKRPLKRERLRRRCG